MELKKRERGSCFIWGSCVGVPGKGCSGGPAMPLHTVHLKSSVSAAEGRGQEGSPAPTALHEGCLQECGRGGDQHPSKACGILVHIAECLSPSGGRDPGDLPRKGECINCHAEPRGRHQLHLYCNISNDRLPGLCQRSPPSTQENLWVETSLEDI